MFEVPVDEKVAHQETLSPSPPLHLTSSHAKKTHIDVLI